MGAGHWAAENCLGKRVSQKDILPRSAGDTFAGEMVFGILEEGTAQMARCDYEGRRHCPDRSDSEVAGYKAYNGRICSGHSFVRRLTTGASRGKIW